MISQQTGARYAPITVSRPYAEFQARPPEDQDHVVGRALARFRSSRPIAAATLFDIGDVAHAPFGVLLAQAGVEHGIAHRGVPALALERAIEKQPAVAAQIAPAPANRPSATRHGAM